MARRATLLVMALCMLLVWGCGYSFQGARAPEGAILEIPIFENKTVETGIEAIFTEEFISEMRKTPGWKIVEPGQGRYLIRGTIMRFVSEPHAVSARNLAVEHRATMVLDVSFREKSSGKELWRDKNLRTFADYPVGRDVLAAERAKREAIARIAQEMASRIRARVQDTW
jgi:hypothetical protein